MEGGQYSDAGNRFSTGDMPVPVHRESKVPKWELGNMIFQMNFNIFFENISDNGT